jgi:hypothetical protein
MGKYLSAIKFIRLFKLCNKVIITLWGGKCAFPGCIHKPAGHYLTTYNGHWGLFNPLKAYASCKYHVTILKPLIDIYIKRNNMISQITFKESNIYIKVKNQLKTIINFNYKITNEKNI